VRQIPEPIRIIPSWIACPRRPWCWRGTDPETLEVAAQARREREERIKKLEQEVQTAMEDRGEWEPGKHRFISARHRHLAEAALRGEDQHDRVA